MLRWIKTIFSRQTLSLNDDERQNLTTFSMMSGAMALTGAIALLVYMQRYSWPEKIVHDHAALLIGGMFNVIYGCLGLMGIMIIAQAVISIGGWIKAAFLGASLEAAAEGVTPPQPLPPPPPAYGEYMP